MEGGARRVRLGEVEAVEVVSRRLHLAAVDDPVAETEEDVLHLATDLGDQMEPTPRVPAHGQRHVDALLGEPPVELGTRERRVAVVDRRLDPHAGRVQAHARLAVPHLAQRELERALPAKVLDPDRLDLVGARRGTDRRQRRPLDCLDVHRARVSRAGLRWRT